MPSQREEVAMQLADTIAFGGLSTPHRGHHRTEHAWIIYFERKGVIEGSIHVYTSKSITIQWKAGLKKGSESCHKAQEVIEFFRKYIR